jgi:hypothetical protein
VLGAEEEEREGKVTKSPVLRLEAAEVQENSPSDASVEGGVVESKLKPASERPQVASEAKSASDRRLITMSEQIPEIARDQNPVDVARESESSKHAVKSEVNGSSSGHRRRRRRHHQINGPASVETSEINVEVEVESFTVVPVPYQNREEETQQWTAEIRSTLRNRSWKLSESAGTIEPGEGELPFVLTFSPHKKGTSKAELHVTIGQVEITWALVGTGL